MNGRGGDQFIPRPPQAEPGGSAPWLDLDDPATLVDEASLAALDVGVPRDSVIHIPGLRHAAVLVPAYRGKAGTELVFVKRPSTARTHAGEVAFPGGMREPEDGELVDTALREAHEEIGLAPDRVRVLARLGRTNTIASRTVVTPFVGWVDEFPPLTREVEEVDRIIHVSVAELLDRSTYHAEKWRVGPLAREMHFFEIEGETIWGLTARIVRSMFDVLFDAHV